SFVRRHSNPAWRQDLTQPLAWRHRTVARRDRQARLRRREVLVHCSWIKSINLMGKVPSFVSIVRRCRGLAVMTTCSVIPRTRMIGAPKTKNVCQSLGLATIIAKTVTTIERPIKRPATKLPACRNLASGFFMIHSDPDCDGREPKASVR